MTDDQLNAKLDEQFAKFFGQVTAHVDKRSNELRSEIQEIRADVHRVYDAIDAVAKKIETDDQERAAMTSQLDRHEAWIGQLAKHTGTRLAPEQ